MLKKKLLAAIVILLMSFALSSCEKVIENSKTLNFPKNYQLLFKLDNEQENSTFIYVTAKVVSYKPFKVESDDLEEVKAINKLTGEQTYGYVLKRNKSNGRTEEESVPREAPPTVEHGYFFVGRCLVYGTLYTFWQGNTTVYYFYPCGINCVALPDICPPDDDWWA
jgi:hypothetical protein